MHEFVGLGFLLEGAGEGLHEFEAEVSFVVEDFGAAPWAGVDYVGFGAREGWGDHDLVGTVGVVEEDVEAEVVAVEGPAPGLGGRGCAEDEEVVRVLVHDLWEFDDFAEEVVYTHGGEGFLVTFGGEAGFNDGEDGIDLGLGEFFQAETKGAEEWFRVRPRTPFAGVQRVEELGLLISGYGRKDFVGGGGNLFDRYAFILDWVEVWLDGACNN